MNIFGFFKYFLLQLLNAFFKKHNERKNGKNFSHFISLFYNFQTKKINLCHRPFTFQLIRHSRPILRTTSFYSFFSLSEKYLPWPFCPPIIRDHSYITSAKKDWLGGFRKGQFFLMFSKVHIF